MLQIFTKEDICRIKERMAHNPAYLEKINSNTKDVRKKLYIQKTGIGTWYHYFTCPECGTRLTFDYYNNESFTCPNCHSTQSGEPYLGAWWEWILCLTTMSAYELALAYIGTEDRSYFNKAREILLGYADNYKNYEVHGGIPYNKPGRFLSQVLSDCEPICNLSKAYALLKDELDVEEQKHIEKDLLRPAAEHQIKNLTPQRHNHEVAICTSIAAVALATDDEELLKFALNTKYGLKYQIDHSFLEDNLWFEGSIGYHQYALLWIITYESMAKNTEYSLLQDNHYADKIFNASLFFKHLYIGNGVAARLNDGSDSLSNSSLVYEHLYTHFGSDELLSLLRACYVSMSERTCSLNALVYGADNLPGDIPEIERKNYISKSGSNLAMIRGSDNRYLCFKALPFAGEHDHYDRLSISFDAFDMKISTDFGTSSGYGSPYHYSYFKNTATHNTVVIDGKNMPPCDTQINSYIYNSDDDIYLDAQTLPYEEYAMLDSFTIKQWDEESYRGVRMRRIISWHDKYFVDIFAIESDNNLKKDWTWHVNAKNATKSEAEYIGQIAPIGPQSYFRNAYSMSKDGMIKCEYTNGDLKMDIHTHASNRELIFAEGPGNPANETVSYLIERTNEKCPVYVNVIEAYKGESIINSVKIDCLGRNIRVVVNEKCGKTRTLNIDI